MAAVARLKVRGSVRDAAAAGRRDLLVALRDKIAGEIDGDVHPRDLAALSRRLIEVATQLESFDDAADDISVAAAIPDEAWSVKRG